MEFQFLHPTCREGTLIFVRDNAPVLPKVITSIFGCIRKPFDFSQDQLYLQSPSQTFTKYSDCPANVAELIESNSNIPVINLLEPGQFIPYLNGVFKSECFWAKYDGLAKIGNLNIYSPIIKDDSHNCVVF